MAEQTAFDVFLSYNSKDRPAVVRLAERLKAKGLKVWLDVWELRPGKPWQEVLEESIEFIPAAAILVGQDGIGPWQGREMRSYLTEFVEHNKSVIPVLLEGCPAQPKLPIFLKHFTWVDLRDGQNEDGFHRLLWGITGEKPRSQAPLGNEGLEAFPEPVEAAPSSQEVANGNSQEEGSQAEAWEPAKERPIARTRVKRRRPEPAEPFVARSQAPLGNAVLEAPASSESASISLPGNGSQTGVWEPGKLAKPVGEPAEPFSIFRHTLRDGSLGPEMVLVPAGEFRMGDLDGSGNDTEMPVHRVRIAWPFFLGRHAVTFEEYDRYAQDKGIKPPHESGWGRGRRPVIHVSWEDALAYCQWLAEQTGKPYRLPSEAEWEYAARAGTETAYWWGKEAGKEKWWGIKAGEKRANFDGSGTEWSNKQTAPVGSFPPNPWGLYDTAGNVWEWVQDRWHDNYQGAPDDGSAWETGSSKGRVLRGGSWFDFGRFVRSASRFRSGPIYRIDSIGFRLALDPLD